MAFRYCIRYLASSAWAFLVEFRNLLLFSSVLAFISPLLRLNKKGCFPAAKPWCWLGWANVDEHVCDVMAPTASEPRGSATTNPVEQPAVAVDAGAQGPAAKRFTPLVVAMVGLPARGKTVAAHKLARYLTWTGHATKVFSMSHYRRRLMTRYASSDIFSADNNEAMEIRRQSLAEAMDDAGQWIEDGGAVAILDGTNATRSKRQWIHDHFTEHLGYKVLFVECVCDQEEALARNVKEILKNSPDYQNTSFEKALEDFKRKVQHYMDVYQPMRAKQEPNLSFVRYINEGEDLSVHRLNGQSESDVLTFLTSFSPAPKTLYFSRHGESEYNVLGRIGGDTDLSPRGQQYGKSLARHINEAKIPNLRVWTSKLKRTQQTTRAVRAACKEALPELNELDAGVCEGLSYEEMAEKFPQEFAWRDQDKLRYRYPWGESYVDIMERVRPVLLELEGQNNVLTVSHQAVLRCILGYFTNKSHEDVPYIDVPLHTIIKLTSDGFNYNMELIKLPVECVDTYRKQPKNLSPSRSIDEVLMTVPAHFDAQFDTNKLWQMMGSSTLLH